MEHHLPLTARPRRTTIILSAKHGQSPTNGAALTRIDDGAIIDGLNAAWAKQPPQGRRPLVAASSTTTACCCGCRTAAAPAPAFARNYLAHYDGTGTGKDGQAAATDIAGAAKAYTSAGLDPKRIYAGRGRREIHRRPDR